MQNIIAFLNVPRSEFRSNSSSNVILENFLENRETLLMYVVEKTDKKKTILFSSDLDHFSASSLQFVKTRPVAVTDENMRDLLLVVASREKNLQTLNSLYRQVLISYIDTQKENSSSGLQHLIQRLDEELNKLGRDSTVSTMSELEYFENLETTSTEFSINDTKLASFFRSVAPDLRKLFRTSLSISEIFQIINSRTFSQFFSKNLMFLLG